MLIYSMGVSVDGFIADREGAFGWTVPSEDQFRFHIEQVRELGGYLCGRRLYETMLPWETDPSLRDNELGAAFADVWCAIPKVVFSRTLDSVQGDARLAEAVAPATAQPQAGDWTHRQVPRRAAVCRGVTATTPLLCLARRARSGPQRPQGSRRRPEPTRRSRQARGARLRRRR